MDIKTRPRHSRQGFIKRMSSNSLVTSLANSSHEQDHEIIDFSPEQARAKYMRPARLIRHIPKRPRSHRAELPFHSFKLKESDPLMPPGKNSGEAETNFLAKLAAEIKSIESFSAAKNQRFNNKRESRPDGKRIEQFENGSICIKDAVGRVIEISAATGECLYLNYDKSNELCTFTRTDADGKIHSTGEKCSQGVTVRDGDGRVKAIGEFMTIDTHGRFYLHTANDQFFSLDLIAGIHCERRRLVNPEGEISFLTASFARDGFRMATVFASSKAHRADRREAIYRFYGRDGSVVEFKSEEQLRDLNASTSMPPGSLAVHKTWLHCRQADTAWDAVKEYLACVN